MDTPTNPTPLSETLIASAIAAEAARTADAVAAHDAIAAAVKSQFAAALQIWLGEFLAEIMPWGHPEPAITIDYPPLARRWRLTFDAPWREARVRVCAVGEGTAIKDSRIGLYVDDREIAVESLPWPFQPFHPDSLGRMLYKTVSHIADQRRSLAENAERARVQDIRRWRLLIEESQSAENLNLNALAAVALYPDEAENWSAAREQALGRIAAREQALAEVAARAEAARRAQEELEARARAMFKPFVIYEVIYGARSEDDGDGPTFYTDEAFTAQPDPGPGGWWNVIARGAVRQMRLSNVMSIERVEVTAPNILAPFVMRQEWISADDCEITAAAVYMPAETGVEFIQI